MSKVQKGQKTVSFEGKTFEMLPHPIPARILPNAARILKRVPSDRSIDIIGRHVPERLVLYARPGTTVPIDRAAIGLLHNDDEELEKELGFPTKSKTVH